MSKAPENLIVVRGTWGEVRYAVRSNGRIPAETFIGGLTESEKRKVGALFRRLAEVGKIVNRQQFKKLEGYIWEFKKGQIRIGGFQIGRSWFLTHGFMKKRDDWPEAEVKRAKDIRKEHLAKR